MRQYGTVSPLFWTGKTGRKLRSDRDAQVIALYLMTNPHSHQTGLYYLPLMYLANEVGIPIEGARKALLTLAEDEFCRYDEVSEWVWVCEMATWQIGAELKANDRRALGVQNYLESAPELPFTRAFFERYQADFHLRATRELGGSEAPSKGHTLIRTEQNKNRTRARAEGEQGGNSAADAVASHARAFATDPTPPKGGRQSESSRDDAAQHAEWEAVAELYPPGAARADWIGAERAARLLVEKGDATWAALRAGVTRYATHCLATNRMVTNPVKFFTDGDKPWRQAWPLPAGKTAAGPTMDELRAKYGGQANG